MKGGRSTSCVVGAAIAITTTCAGERTGVAFDKRSCALAYETAQQLRIKQKLRLSREQLITCGHSSCPSVVTKDCSAWLEEVESELASVLFRARDGKSRDLTEVRISIDGQTLREQLDGGPVFVDPGPHLFHFESDANGTADVYQALRKGERGRVIEVTLKARQDEPPKVDPEVAVDKVDAGAADRLPNDVQDDEKKAESKPPIELQLTRPDPSHGGPGTGTYVAAGIGVLALSSFAYFELKASSDVSDLRSTCAPYCPASEIDAVRSKLVVANVSLGVGVTALGVAGLLWFVRSSGPAQPASSLRFDLVPTAGQRGAQLVTTFTAP